MLTSNTSVGALQQNLYDKQHRLWYSNVLTIPFYLSTEPILNNIRSWKLGIPEAVSLIENAREEIQSILEDVNWKIDNDVGVDQRISRILWTYLGFEPRWYVGTTKGHETPLQMFASLLKDLLEFVARSWYYDGVMYASIENASVDIGDVTRNPKGVHIRFFKDPTNDNFAAATGDDVKGHLIMINLSSFDLSREGDLLKEILPKLELGGHLDSLFISITPILLHECIHSVNPKKHNDIALHRDEMPIWFDPGREEIQGYNHLTYIPCYGDYMCRALAKLARMRYQLQEAGCAPSKMIGKRRAPFRNVENINRALVSIWFAGQEEDLDFAPVVIDAASKVRRTFQQSLRFVDVEKRENNMPISLHDLRDVRGPPGATGHVKY